ncbi:MAG TPA: hypothetical protein VF698_14315, partial [Thermoanaerobaculia bacterium]
IVVLKGGTQYKAKAKWTVVNGKAIVQLENGQTLTLNPNDIDVQKSERTTALGLGEVKMLDLDPNLPAAQQPKKQPSLGSQVKLRNLGAATTTAAPAPIKTDDGPTPIAGGGPPLSIEVTDKFDRAYENVGIFEKHITATGPRSLRAELTTDNEDKVFNAISATSFLIVRNAGITNAQIDLVELYMKTTTGGAAGRFKMSREDAEALERIPAAQRDPALRDYYVKKVLF